MQTALSQIWTWVDMCISSDDIYYTIGTYNEHNSLTPRHKITEDMLTCH